MYQKPTAIALIAMVKIVPTDKPKKLAMNRIEKMGIISGVIWFDG